MASSTLRSTSQIPDIEEEEDEQFDLLKCSKIEVGAKLEELPRVGFNFLPTDDEIVVYYLFNKILDRVLSISDIIKEIDLYEYDPNQLPIGDFRWGEKLNEAFYFTYIEQIYCSKGKATKRTTKGGYWKVSGKEQEITYGKDDVTVGFQNYMIFYQGQAPKGTRTRFAMHEYRIKPSVVPAHVLNDAVRRKIQRYVVCRIINREKTPK